MTRRRLEESSTARPFAALSALLALATIGILVVIAVHYLWPLS
jgi:hypothetical protein